MAEIKQTDYHTIRVSSVCNLQVVVERKNLGDPADKVHVRLEFTGFEPIVREYDPQAILWAIMDNRRLKWKGSGDGGESTQATSEPAAEGPAAEGPAGEGGGESPGAGTDLLPGPAGLASSAGETGEVGEV